MFLHSLLSPIAPSAHQKARNWSAERFGSVPPTPAGSRCRVPQPAIKTALTIMTHAVGSSMIEAVF